MFEALTRLFGKPEAPPDLHDPKLAVAALLVHLAAVDGSMQDAERKAIHGALMDHYDLDAAAVEPEQERHRILRPLNEPAPQLRARQHRHRQARVVDLDEVLEAHR